MIRPITFTTFLLACGSGLYLYQAKHGVHVLDRQIEQTVKATDALREQTRMLRAEWTLLNDPERLRQLSDQFLTLKTVSPSQFTSLAELDNRLPPIQPKPAPSTVAPSPAPQPEQAPVASVPVDASQIAQQNSDDFPLPPPEPPAAPAVVATAHVVANPPVDPARVPERKPAAPKPVVAQTVSPRVATPEARPVEPRPVVAAAPAYVPAGPSSVATSGSLLGMARGMTTAPAPVPLPRPTPVNVTQFSYTNGG